MTPSRFIVNDLDPFKAGNALLKNSYQTSIGESFKEIFEAQTKEVTEKIKEKAVEVPNNDKNSKKKTNKNLNQLPDTTELLRSQDRKDFNNMQRVYSLLDKFRESKQYKDEEEFSKGARQQALNNVHNIAGQSLIQPIYDQNGKKPSKAQLLSTWDKFAPNVTEDITKKSVRIDIPLLNDVHALVLRLHPDKSLTASLLGSKAMGKLIKENKDKLDRNLRHHHLSLREFNTYHSELTFNSESGTRKQKKKTKAKKIKGLDLV